MKAGDTVAVQGTVIEPLAHSASGTPEPDGTVWIETTHVDIRGKPTTSGKRVRVEDVVRPIASDVRALRDQLEELAAKPKTSADVKARVTRKQVAEALGQILDGTWTP